VGELRFNRENEFIPLGKITVVKTAATRQLPDPLNGMPFGAVGRQKVERETFGLLLPPFSVKPGVMVFGIVRNHDYGSSGWGAGGPKVF
jgi:hypothetical protein